MLDYCNVACLGLPLKIIQKLQLIQSAAVQVTMGILFKVLVITFKDSCGIRLMFVRPPASSCIVPSQMLF